MPRSATLAVLLCVVGCSSHSPSAPATADGSAPAAHVLDCAWTSGDNCWKDVVAPAMGCLPPNGLQGTMSADGTTCTYPSGSTIAFEPPLFIGPYSTFTNFAVTTNGIRCMTYASMSPTSSSFITVAGTVSLAGDQANQSITVTCPDGSRYTGALQDLKGCASGFPSLDLGYGGFPGPDGGSTNTLSLTLNDTGTPNTTPVFYCTD